MELAAKKMNYSTLHSIFLTSRSGPSHLLSRLLNLFTNFNKKKCESWIMAFDLFLSIFTALSDLVQQKDMKRRYWFCHIHLKWRMQWSSHACQKRPTTSFRIKAMRGVLRQQRCLSIWEPLTGLLSSLSPLPLTFSHHITSRRQQKFSQFLWLDVVH